MGEVAEQLAVFNLCGVARGLFEDGQRRRGAKG
jgi:hypothetical protein